MSRPRNPLRVRRRATMAEAEIPVDLLNPGQVFACLGLMEATEILSGPCFGAFEYGAGEMQVRFRLKTEANAEPVREVVEFLAKAKVSAIAPRKSGLSTDGWGVPTEERDLYPAPIPQSPASLAIILRGPGSGEISIEHWTEGPRGGRDNVKVLGRRSRETGWRLGKRCHRNSRKTRRERTRKRCGGPICIRRSDDEQLPF
jgi:CRISPR-associated protein Csb3